MTKLRQMLKHIDTRTGIAIEAPLSGIRFFTAQDSRNKSRCGCPSGYRVHDGTTFALAKAKGYLSCITNRTKRLDDGRVCRYVFVLSPSGVIAANNSTRDR